jgi:hypothetical protein
MRRLSSFQKTQAAPTNRAMGGTSFWRKQTGHLERELTRYVSLSSQLIQIRNLLWLRHLALLTSNARIFDAWACLKVFMVQFSAFCFLPGVEAGHCSKEAVVHRAEDD